MKPQYKEEGIVLQAIRYDDSRLVIRVFTLSSGLRSYIVRPSRKGAAGTGMVMFQPLTHLRFEATRSRGPALETIRHASLVSSPLLSASGVLRPAIALFLADLLNHTITHHESDAALFGLIKEVIARVTQGPEELLPDIPLIFMMQQASAMGFEPLIGNPQPHQVFDLMEGRFVETATHGHYIPADWTNLFAHTALSSREGFHPLKIPSGSRATLLAFVIEYFRLQIPGLEELKSVQVLHEVLAVL